jgi:hypothetical protein
MHKNATKCNETLSKWCKNKHGHEKLWIRWRRINDGGDDGADGDGSRGTSSSRHGAGTETSIPRNSPVAAAELQDFFWKIAD